MDYLNAIIFGIVQGITEFIPISSSGHLFILHEILDLPIVDNLTFDVTLHLASLFAVIIFFKREIWQLVRSFFNLLKGKRDRYSSLVILIVIGTVPAALIGYFFEDIIEEKFRSIYVVVTMLIVVAMLFFDSEKSGKKKYNIDNLNWKNVLFIGFAQAIALIPGTSRSGITMVAGLYSGLRREEAVKFSFLLSIPIILGASLFKITDINFASLVVDEFIILFLASIFSFISAFFAIKYFLNFVEKYSLKSFAIYRIALGIIIFLILIF
jgi:undecaprenyl-diphosphatase